MAKISSIGSNGFFGGYDLSGDITALGVIGMSVNQQDITTLKDTAMERLNLRRDGEITINAIFNPSTARSHPVLKAMPSTDIGVMWTASDTAGCIAAMLMAKQANFPNAIAADGSMLLTAQALASTGVGLEWGQLITAGKRTDTAATATGTGIDMGVPPASVAITITSASAASPTVVLTASAHGYTTGDSVIIASTDKAALNDEFTITVTSTTQFTVPVDLTSGAATGGNVTLTSTRTNWAAQRQSFSFTGTSSTVTLQHAPKNASASFVDVTSGAFAAATALGFERITGAASALLQRYVRVKTTGTFTEHSYSVGVLRL